MPWHLSKSDPRKVYDETHAVVGVMQTATQAAFIVECVNKVRKEDGDKSTQGTGEHTQLGGGEQSAPVSLTHTYQEDECCGKYLAKFIRSGKADKSAFWRCPKCGCDWVNKSVGMFSHWTPVAVMEVIR